MSQLKASQTDAGKQSTFILFRMANTYWASDVESVQRVHPQLSVHKVPGTQAWFLGVAQVDGELLSVSDLGYWLNKTTCQGPVLQMDKHLGAVGLRVDEVISAQTLKPSDVSLSASDVLMPGALAQTVTHNNTQFRVVAFHMLVQSPAFIAIRKVRTA